MSIAAAAGIGAGEGMPLVVLTLQQPIEIGDLRDILARPGQGVEGERGDPGGQIGIDRPGTIGPDGVDEELHP